MRGCSAADKRKVGMTMKTWKKWGTALVSAALALSLWGCTIPMPGFADYDVSGYIKALLDSSYHASTEDLMAVAKITEDKAMEYNTTTVENAAVSFCNTYGLSPSDQQLQELQKVMRQAFALTRYTVKDEQKVETGYYLEVEVTSIINFSGREADIEKLKEQAQQEATAANTDLPSTVPGDGEEGGEEEYGGEDEYEEEAESSEESGPAGEEPPAASQKVDANELFVEKVLNFCKKELANISYDAEPRTIPLDIRQTEKGELQLDTKQLDHIDGEVVRFSK